MNYVILDMEWNQGYPNNRVYIRDSKKLLAGEIIQIGAVKLDEKFDVISTYNKLVKPAFYKNLHFKVRELTGISKEELISALPFTDIFPDFISWCGESFEFLIWGFDDINILKQNIAVNGIENYPDFPWYNLQLIYTKQYNSENNQIALHIACEALGINEDKQLHDALNDAIYTAEICKHLDMESGMKYCHEQRILSEKNCKRKYRYSEFPTAKEALLFSKNCDNFCPLCKNELTLKIDYIRKYYNQFIAVRECSSHGLFTEIIVVSKINDSVTNSKFKAAKTLLRAENEEAAINAASAKKRRRRRKKQPVV